MKFVDYLFAHRGLMKVLALELGLKCPLACRHCYNNSGPNRTEQMSLSAVIRAIREFSEVPTAEIVMLTGGEPFAYRKHLQTALEEVAAHENLQSYVITSGYFATSVSATVTLLSKLPPIDLLTVSADKYHEEFIPLDRVKNTLIACEQLEIDGCLAVTLDRGDEFYLNRLKDELGFDLFRKHFQWSTWVHPDGRAKSFGAYPDTFKELPPKQVCHVAGSPAVLPDQTITLCCESNLCADAPSAIGSPINRGRLGEKTLLQIYEEMDYDPIVQALRALGPTRIYEILVEEQYSIEKTHKYHKICGLCRELIDDPKVVDKLWAVLQKPNYAQEIKLSRLIHYFELAGTYQKVY